jgi:lipopolysaccharide transport protein LptA/LPS export ABC transporter protein LptC
MAMTTASSANPDGASQRRLALVVAGDRTGEFRSARRRSRGVRLMRWLLPMLTITLLGGYAMTILKSAGLATSMPEISLRKILPEDLAMKDPRYEGFGKDGSSYTFTAKTARQDLAKLNQIELDQISGWVLQADKSRTDVTATRGSFDHEASVLELFDSIDVVSETGLKAKLTRATILAKESLLKTGEPVEVEFPAGTIHASSMTIRQKVKEITFVDDVRVALKPQAPADATAQANRSSDFFAQSNEPIDIVSERLDINDAVKTALFSGEVKAAQGDGTLTTPELEITYEGNASGTGGKSEDAPPADGAAKQPAKIHRIVAREPVVMTRGEEEVVSSKSADFDVANETAVLTGDVIMISGPERRATGDKVELNQRADTALLLGNVQVVQGKNLLSGSRLFIDRKGGRTQLTSPAETGGSGRIFARLYQGDAKAQPAKANAKETQTSGGAFTFKTDPTAPVEIEADQLNVNDTAKVAVFEGSVNAVQGEFTISSSELHAFYKGGSGLAEVTSAGPRPPEGQSKEKPPSELTRIEAKKNVIVTSRQGQTATGDWAEFDAKTRKVMVGGDVVVTQGQNMVRGTRLVIDMNSGESKIDTAPAKTASKPSGGGWTTEAPEPGSATPDSPGRASAVFFPQQLKNGQKEKPREATTPEVDGWSAKANPDTSTIPGN